MPTPEIQVKASGPLFDGRAQAAISEFLQAATAAVAGEGVNLIHQVLPKVLKHPTGYYESHIQTDMVAPDSARVWDEGVIYGPWLEGIGSRNQSTRFKGYGTFRRVAYRLQERAHPIMLRMLDRYVRQMNGQA